MKSKERKEKALTVEWLRNRAMECGLMATAAAEKNDLSSEKFWSEQAVTCERKANQVKGDGNAIN